jgi:hypothetical protein
MEIKRDTEATYRVDHERRIIEWVWSHTDMRDDKGYPITQLTIIHDKRGREYRAVLSVARREGPFISFEIARGRSVLIETEAAPRFHRGNFARFADSAFRTTFLSDQNDMVAPLLAGRPWGPAYAA